MDKSSEIAGSRAEEFEYLGEDLDDMSFAPKYHQWILDEFRPHVGRDILEVGAGTGNFSKLLLDETLPMSFTALEPASRNCKYLGANLDGYPQARVVNGFLSDFAPMVTAQLDTIFYINVLEHVLDDCGELKLASKILKPGGVICIFVPALGWLYSSYDAKVGHFRRYYKEQLLGTIRGAGLDLIKCKYFDLPGVFPWLALFRIMGQESIRAGRASLYDNLVVPTARRLERVFPPPFGKNLLAVCKKS